MELFKEYKTKSGETIMFDGISMYEDFKRMPLDIFTSSKHEGQWDKKGKYLTNVYFLNGEPSEMDITK